MKLIRLFLAIPVLISLCQCSTSEEIDTSTAEGAFSLAQRFEKNERFEESIRYYSEVKNKHPYSRYATEAELRIAAIHYERESFVEAEAAYRLFKEFHPKHPQIAFVTYRLGMSLFKQLPDTIDRDLSLADKAILYFDEVIRSYPSSEYAPKAQENKTKALKMLAEKELYIARFYFIRDMFDSALGRFEDLMKKYPNLGYDKDALYGATVSAHKIDNKTKMTLYLGELAKRFPDSSELKEARKEVGDGI